MITFASCLNLAREWVISTKILLRSKPALLTFTNFIELMMVGELINEFCSTELQSELEAERIWLSISLAEVSVHKHGEIQVKFSIKYYVVVTTK